MTTINYIKGELEDKEREDMFRISIVKHKRNKDQSIKIKLKAPIPKEHLTEGVLANTKMLETSIKKDAITRPLNPISKFNLLWLNLANQPFSQIVMISSELKGKQIMDPSTSYDYKLPKRNSGHHVLSDHGKCHLPLLEALSSISNADRLLVIKTSEESYNDDKFIPPLGFRILGGLTEVVDLFSDDLSNEIFEVLSKSEISNGGITLQFSSSVSTISAPISSEIAQSLFDMNALKYVIIELSKLKTRWSIEFLKAIQCALRFFHLREPDTIEFCFDKQEKQQEVKYNLKIVSSTETNTAIIISDVNKETIEKESAKKSIHEMKIVANSEIKGEGVGFDRDLDDAHEDDENIDDNEILKSNSSY